MGESVQYIGSKISLISKSEIRYEGTLYTIDAQDSIIVLAKVLSFGTEDRPCEMPVPAKKEVFEFIIFRGTDIKQIEVCEAPKPLSSIHNDPAIVGVQVQQHAAPSVATSYPGASFSHQPLGPIGSVGSYYGNYSQPLGQQSLPSSGFSIGVSQPSELSGGMGSSVGGVNLEAQCPAGNNQTVPAPIGVPPRSTVPQSQAQQDVLTGSRSSTPSVSRKSPVADAGVQVTPPPPPQQQIDKKRTNQPTNQRPPQNQERHVREHLQNNQNRRPAQQGQNNQYYHQGARHNQGYQGGYQGYYNHQQQYQSQYRGNMNRGRGGPRRSSQPRGRGTFNQAGGKRQVFDKEYDFEQANVQFEEMMTQMAKTKITENGEKKEDSGHETATTGDESEDSSSLLYYDKTKSFFDSISCEALERSKGKSQRSDWRQERKINVETFGVATARRGYYSRGRGGYYARGGYYRNNYNGGYYRGNSNYRGSRGGGSGGAGGSGGNGSNNHPQRNNHMNGAIGGTSAAVHSGNSSYASAVRSSGPAK